MAKWIASLDDGNIIDEKKLSSIVNESEPPLSPWLRLVSYCRENNKKITGLRLLVNGITYNAPSRGKNPKYKNDLEPRRYWVCRKVFLDMGFGGGFDSGESEIALSWLSGEWRHFIWIDLINNNQWVEIKNINDSFENVVNEWYLDFDL